jgi:hypothetical protein
MLFRKSVDADHNSGNEIVSEFAKLVSIVAAPPTVAILATVSFSLWSPIGLGSLSAPFSILICFLCFVFFPFIAVIYLYKKKFSDLDVSKREARTPLLVIAIASYSVAALIFSVTNTRILVLLALGCYFVSLIVMVVNLFWKVSIHCAGVTGPIFSLIFVFGLNALPLALIIGLVAWSRIKRKNHTFSQTLAGTLISLTVGLIIYPLLYV